MSRSFHDRLADLARSPEPLKPDLPDMERRAGRRRGRRRIGAGVGAAVIALAIVVPLRSLSGIDTTPSSGAAATPGYIAVAKHEGDNYGIWLVRPDGTDLHQVPLPVQAIDPAWSPDGSQIAFAGGEERNTEPYNIYLVQPDGEGLQRLTNSPVHEMTSHPSWSPDGRELVFSRVKDGHNQLVVLTLADLSERTIPLPQDFYQSVSPAWSPDGSKIAFEANRDSHGGLYVVNVDGSDLQPLLTNGGESGAQSPAWSPDGSNLAVESKGDIYVVSATGDDAHRLTDVPQLDAAPAWSPDGTQIAFLSGRLRPEPKCGWPDADLCLTQQQLGQAVDHRDLDLFVMDAAGTNQHPVTEGGGIGYSPFAPSAPSWQGIGSQTQTPAPETTQEPPVDTSTPAPKSFTARRILFTVRDDSDGSEDVYSMAADGSDLQPLLTGPEDDSDAVLSPDGTKVAFVRLDRNGPCTDSNVYVAAADGSNQVQLTGSPSDLHCNAPSAAPGTNVVVGVGVGEDEPAWSPDGTRIAMRSADCGIKVVSIDGSDSSCLTPHSSYAAEPIWSPDGSRIAFDSDNGLASDAFGTDIWVMNADGSDPQPVTHDAGGNIVTGWSPDGARLVYQRSVNQSDYGWDVWTIGADGAEPRQLTGWAGFDGNGVFSPDGRSITFASDRFGDAGTVQQGEDGGHAHGLDVYVMPIDGGDATRLTNYAPLTAWPSDWATFDR